MKKTRQNKPYAPWLKSHALHRSGGRRVDYWLPEFSVVGPAESPRDPNPEPGDPIGFPLRAVPTLPTWPILPSALRPVVTLPPGATPTVTPVSAVPPLVPGVPDAVPPVAASPGTMPPVAPVVAAVPPVGTAPGTIPPVIPVVVAMPPVAVLLAPVPPVAPDAPAAAVPPVPAPPPPAACATAGAVTVARATINHANL